MSSTTTTKPVQTGGGFTETRFASTRKNEFFPTFIDAIEHIVTKLTYDGKADTTTTLLDPSCGEGTALCQLAALLSEQYPKVKFETFGNEMNAGRYAVARDKLDHVTKGAHETLQISARANIVFINPPYNIGAEDRLEIEHTQLALQSFENVIIAVLPQKILREVKFWNNWFTRVDKTEAYRMIGPDHEKWGQYIIIGQKKYWGGLGYSERRKSAEWSNLFQRDDTGLPYINEHIPGSTPFEVRPQGRDAMVIKNRVPNGDEVLAALAIKFPDAFHTSRYLDLTMPPPNRVHQRPASPTRKTHVVQRAVAGAVNGIRVELWPGQWYLVTGDWRKYLVKKTIETQDDEKTIDTQKVAYRIICQSITDGHLMVIDSATNQAEYEKFMTEHVDDLMRAVDTSHPPRYQWDYSRWAHYFNQALPPRILPGVKPGMFAAQKHVAAALLDLWADPEGNKHGVIVGEMGTGKTFTSAVAMGVRAGFYDGSDGTVVVLCPPVVAGKWVKEMRNIFKEVPNFAAFQIGQGRKQAQLAPFRPRNWKHVELIHEYKVLEAKLKNRFTTAEATRWAQLDTEERGGRRFYEITPATDPDSCVNTDEITNISTYNNKRHDEIVNSHEYQQLAEKARSQPTAEDVARFRELAKHVLVTDMSASRMDKNHPIGVWGTTLVSQLCGTNTDTSVKDDFTGVTTVKHVPHTYTVKGHRRKSAQVAALKLELKQLQADPPPNPARGEYDEADKENLVRWERMQILIAAGLDKPFWVAEQGGVLIVPEYKAKNVKTRMPIKDTQRAMAHKGPKMLIIPFEIAKNGAPWHHVTHQQHHTVTYKVITEREERARYGQPKRKVKVINEVTQEMETQHCPQCGGMLIDDETGAPWTIGGTKEDELNTKTGYKAKMHCNNTVHRHHWDAGSGEWVSETCGAELYEYEPFSYGGRMPVCWYLNKHHAGEYYAIVDEAHHTKGGDTAIGAASAQLITASLGTLCMTGTIFNGYARSLFYLLYRLDWRFRKMYAFDEVLQFVSAHGMLQTITTRRKGENRSSYYGGYNSKSNTYTHEVPGASPEIISMLTPITVFLRLADVGIELPEKHEIAVRVDMDADQNAAYQELMNYRGEAIQAFRMGNRGPLMRLHNASLGWPDWCEDDYLEGLGHVRGVPMPEGGYAKDRKLLRLVWSELQENRGVAIFCEQVHKRDPRDRILSLLNDNDIQAHILRASVPPDERMDQIEEWVHEANAIGQAPVIILNGSLVREGVDLLKFQTLVEVGQHYNVTSLRQRLARSHRIGQDQEVKIYFMVYVSTMQETAMKHIAHKLAAMDQVNGDVPAGVSRFGSEEDDDDGSDFIQQMMEEAEKTEGADLSDLMQIANFDNVVVGQRRTVTDTATPVVEEKETTIGEASEDLDNALESAIDILMGEFSEVKTKADGVVQLSMF